MKKQKKTLRIEKKVIAKITALQVIMIKGGTDPISLEYEVTGEIIASADASHCGPVGCH